MKRIVLLFEMILTAIPAVRADISVQTIVSEAYSQPPLVGGAINGFSDEMIIEKGIVVSVSNDNLFYDAASKTAFPYYWTGQGEPSVADIVYSTQDLRVIDCSSTGKEQFWCPLLYLRPQSDYYVRAYAVKTDGNVVYGQVESVHSQSFRRYNGRTDYANVWHAFDNTLFDLVTDEIIHPDEGFYYSKNEKPTTVRHQVGTGYNTYYKFLTEWNYQLWYYHSMFCEQDKIVSVPLMTLSKNRLTIEKNPLDATKAITLYYSINGDFFRPETFTDIYTEPIEIQEPCTICCYAISSDGYISYTNMYEIFALEETNDSPVADIVDLGLSVRWASWNIGADTPEGLGDLYAWGELMPKDNYSYSTYRFQDNNYGYTKYGEVDNKWKLDDEDDVARQTWGGQWRMPTFAELEELKEKCTFTEEELNGVPVTKVVGPNGNFIYFPLPGNYTNETLYYENSIGSYWSSELKTSSYARDLDFYGEIPNLNGDTRYHGQSIRPVCEKVANTFSRDITCQQGHEVQLPIEVINDREFPIAGISFTLSLPQGITVVTNEEGEPCYQFNSDRLNPKRFTVYTYQTPDGLWGFRITPKTTTAVLGGTEGEVMAITLSVADDMEAGDYDILLTENMLSVRFSDTVNSMHLTDTTSKLTVTDVVKGDVNGDGMVDLSDAIMVIYYSLGLVPDNFVETVSDMNGDAEIDLSDAIIIIYISLGAYDEPQVNAVSPSIDLLMLAANGNDFTMSLDNQDSYMGFQCDIRVPEGSSLVDISLNPSRGTDHTLMLNRLDDNLYRVAAFSPQGDVFFGRKGELLNFTIDGGNAGQVSVENIFFVNSQLEKKTFENQNAIATGINATKQSESDTQIYDLQGRRVSSVSALRKGSIYISSNKKTVKK